MSRATGAGSYRAVLMLPFALRTFVPALTGRLAYGLFPLATLFTIYQATGSYATAGLATAAFGLTSITLPAKARLVDRLGQRTSLPPLALICSVALASATLVTPPFALVTLIAVAGLAAPPLGSAMRATWRTLTLDTNRHRDSAALRRRLPGGRRPDRTAPPHRGEHLGQRGRERRQRLRRGPGRYDRRPARHHPGLPDRRGPTDRHRRDRRTADPPKARRGRRALTVPVLAVVRGVATTARRGTQW
jgi:hypothetical protein